MGFHNQIYSILRFSWSILLQCGASSREEHVPTILTEVVRDSSRLHLTFVAFCLLPVIRKQFYVISTEFLSLSRRHYFSRNYNLGQNKWKT